MNRYATGPAVNPATEVSATSAAAEPASTQAALPPPSASEGTHPLAVSAEEGLFAVDQQSMIALLQKMLKLKYTAVLMYMNYGDRARSHFRDALYGHFQEHMREEQAACYDLVMKITALGGEPEVQVAKVPSTPVLTEMFAHIMQMEKQLIALYREIIAACGDHVGLRVQVESALELDQRHLDDARRMSVLSL